MRELCVAVAAALSAGLCAVPASAAPPGAVSAASLRLTAADTSLGGGTAFIMGGSGLQTPGQAYADAVVSLYLAPLGFTGTTTVVSTPEELYPFFGPFGGMLDNSLATGQKTLDTLIVDDFHAGKLSAENPAVVFGWSQSSVIASDVQSQLASQGVPSEDVRFVLIGDVSAPNGGMLERFDLPQGTDPTIPSLGITFSGAGPSDLYPTYVYTHEYDGFADFPKYPINFLSDLNSLLGIAFEHTTYLGLTPEQIDHAIALPTSSADTMDHYFMIPTQGLPLLDPLLFFGSGGKALYDLLEPDMRILVNLGYGDIADGWAQGDADVATPLGFLPDSRTTSQLAAELPAALKTGWQQGVTAFMEDVAKPSNASPAFLTELGSMVKTLEGTTLSSFFSTPTTWHELFDTFPPHTGIPAVDVATALLITLPEIDYNTFTSEMAQGNVLDAIGMPIAADLGIVPIALLGAVL